MAQRKAQSSVETYYHTNNEDRRGMLVFLGVDRDHGQYGISVFNQPDNSSSFVFFDRAEMIRIRDAINKELAS